MYMIRNLDTTGIDHIILPEEGGGGAVMVTCSTRMKGPDLTGEKINLGIKDEEAPLIKIRGDLVIKKKPLIQISRVTLDIYC